ncbi:hypothetical protein BJY01DRAFT_229520 [Aspergillus pseudoustus]|uniref:Uncharacterized protein n=1 Tax=Aspergillus pseudoustus TaxID=1810923 RepID=A0ABR4IH43_9EURO
MRQSATVPRSSCLTLAHHCFYVGGLMADQVTPTGSFIDSVTPPPSDRKSTRHIRSILNAFQ